MLEKLGERRVMVQRFRLDVSRPSSYYITRGYVPEQPIVAADDVSSSLCAAAFTAGPRGVRGEPSADRTLPRTPGERTPPWTPVTWMPATLVSRWAAATRALTAKTCPHRHRPARGRVLVHFHRLHVGRASSTSTGVHVGRLLFVQQNRPGASPLLEPVADGGSASTSTGHECGHRHAFGHGRGQDDVRDRTLRATDRRSHHYHSTLSFSRITPCGQRVKITRPILLLERCYSKYDSRNHFVQHTIYRISTHRKKYTQYSIIKIKEYDFELESFFRECRKTAATHLGGFLRVESRSCYNDDINYTSEKSRYQTFDRQHTNGLITKITVTWSNRVKIVRLRELLFPFIVAI